jgi:hypothetical protein
VGSKGDPVARRKSAFSFAPIHNLPDRPPLGQFLIEGIADSASPLQVFQQLAVAVPEPQPSKRSETHRRLPKAAESGTVRMVQSVKEGLAGRAFILEDN